MSHEPPDIEEIRTALGPEAHRVEITPAERLRDAVHVVVPEPAIVTTWIATAAVVARRLREAGYRVERNSMGTRMWVRAPLQPGELGLRQVVAKGHRARRYRVAGEWDLVDSAGHVVGAAWRVGDRGEQDKVYRVRLAGLPENPRTYRSLNAAVGAAERALAVHESR